MSNTRTTWLKKYLTEELASLDTASFESYGQGGKIDYLLLRNYLSRRLGQLDLDAEKNEKIESLLPFARKLISICEARQRMEAVDGKEVAEDLSNVSKQPLRIAKEDQGTNDSG